METVSSHFLPLHKYIVGAVTFRPQSLCLSGRSLTDLFLVVPLLNLLMNINYDDKQIS